MPLEFPCPNCQHLLRTADDKAGLSATCPACGESIWVPYAHQLGAQSDEQRPPESEDESADEYELDGDDSFVPDSTSTAPDTDADNPFADESSPQDPPDAESYALARSQAEEPARDVGVTCEHCGTENEPGAEQCRACAADLQPPPVPPPRRRRPDTRDPDIGAILGSSWKIFVDEIGLLIGAMMLLILISIGVGLVCAIPAGIGAAIGAAVDDDLIFVGYLAGILLSLPLSIVANAVLQIGYVRLNLNVARGLPAGVGDLFYGFGEGRSHIIPVVVVGLAAAVFTFCTCLLGILVVWPYSFLCSLLIVHRRTDTGDSFNQCIELIQKEMGTVLLIGLMLVGAYIAISMLNLCFYIGLILAIFAVPFLVMMMTVAYLRMERERIAVDRD